VITTLPEFDIRMELVLAHSFVDVTVHRYGVYELSGTRFFQNMLQPGMTVIDVGANSGYYSIIAARLVGSHGHVHGFEPLAGPLEKFKRNVEINDFHNITIYQRAVGRRNGDCLVFPSNAENNDGLGSILPGHGRSDVPERAEMTSLDSFLSEVPTRKVDLIKVDVEGSEGEVFAGAKNLLASPQGPAIMFESFDISPIVESLGRYGYEVRHLHYSLRNGLEFPQVGDAFENLYAAYEAPNYVALKTSDRFGTFEEISQRSKRALSGLLKMLASVA